MRPRLAPRSPISVLGLRVASALFLAACSTAQTPPAAPAPRRAGPEVAASAPVTSRPRPDETRPEALATALPVPSEGRQAPSPATATSTASSAPGALAELSAYERAKPVFERECVRCHAPGTRSTSGSAMQGVDMSTYPFGGGTPKEVARRIGRSVGLFDAPATMPPTRLPRLRGEDAAVIAAWIETVR